MPTAGHAPSARKGTGNWPLQLPPPLQARVSESSAHRSSLCWRFRATKLALFNTGFSYLGWKINSTIIKSIKYTKLDFFSRDGSKHKLAIKRVAKSLEMVFAVWKFP